MYGTVALLDEIGECKRGDRKIPNVGGTGNQVIML